MGARRLVLVAMLVAGVLVGAQSPARAADGCWDFHSYEKDLAAATNASRSDAGLRGLVLDPELSMAARVHSRDMARAGKTYHSRTDDIAPLLKGSWELIGENVGAGGTVRSLHELFLQSPSHRANIFKARWNRVGVGEVFRDGRHWVTVLFEDGADLDTTMRRRAC